MKTTSKSHGLRPVLIDDADLFGQAIATKNLMKAWSRVWRNQGCAGGDGVTLAHFQRGVAQRLGTLSRDVLRGDYGPAPLRQVDIAKPGGGTRRLSIPAIGDRVLQTAVAAALGPLLDEEFEDNSFAYRPGRSVAQAVARIDTEHRRGAAYIVDADIDDFFDTVPHDNLLDRLGQSMTQGPLTELIGLWLEQGGENGRGLAQGSPLSPLLANLYLDRLDEAFARRKARIVRYADDFVILCETTADAEAALEKAKALLSEQGLRLNTERSRVLSFEKGFRFLGHLFMRSLVLKSAAGRDDEQALELLRDIAARDVVDLKAEKKRLSQRQAGLDPGLRVLYIMEEGRRLSVRNKAFCVQEQRGGIGEPHSWDEILALPNAQVDRIEIGSRASLDPPAMALALASGTPLAMVDGWGQTKGWVSGGVAARAGRQFKQAELIVDGRRRLALARQFVDGRVRNQRALLRRLNRTRKDTETFKVLAAINRQIKRVPTEDSIAALMGVEGHTTALYWPAFGRMLRAGFRFAKRERKGAADPVNIMLNMTSFMLTRDVTVALQRAGLHTGFGVLHTPRDNGDALAYDLMEEFRVPLCESVVATAVNTGAMGIGMFVRRHGGCRMGRSATTALIKTYERAISRPVKSAITGKRHTWREIISLQAFLLASHFEGRAPYKPYIMDY
jgi:group II intron reverse transcriptase/maturase/CRISPR-associated endonuclease Cas1